MKPPKSWSLKSRVTVSFMIVVLCISLALSFLYYGSQRRQFEANLIENSQNDLTYLMGNVEKQLRLCQKLSDWVYTNRSIEKTLVRDYTSDMKQYSREIPPVQRLIDDQLMSSAIGKYVVFMFITGYNGVTYKAMGDADWIAVPELVERPWYGRGMAAGANVVWQGITENPARYKTQRMVVPLARPVVFTDTRVEIGWHVIAFSPAVVGDVFQDYRIDENNRIILVDQNAKAVFHYDPKMTGKVMDYGFLAEITGGNGSGYWEIDGRQRLVVYNSSPYAGMTMLLIHSLAELETQTKFMGGVLAALVIVTAIMFFILTYYLSNRLTKPLKGILERLREASGGVFKIDESLDGNDEMGQIGRGVNEMAASMGALMEELITREREKSELEYRVLLNQINPHFVYNVLNSIKVMADIQKIEGISQVAAALGKLLKEISKGSEEQVSISRELELLESYLYLQKIRRCGLLNVTYDIPDEAVLDCLIPRFTLQPIAENAIYHGIDKNGGMGEISISIKLDGGDIRIVVRDNGAGIPQDRLKGLLKPQNVRRGEMTSVGLANVDARIKLCYGCGGLELESVENEYTSVSIRFPSGLDGLRRGEEA